jgi:hypothetical protein
MLRAQAVVAHFIYILNFYWNFKNNTQVPKERIRRKENCGMQTP